MEPTAQPTWFVARDTVRVEIGGLGAFAKELENDLAHYGDAGQPGTTSVFSSQVQGALTASVFGHQQSFPEAVAARTVHDHILRSAQTLYREVVHGYRVLAMGARTVATQYGDEDNVSAGAIDKLFPPPPPRPQPTGPYTPGPGSVKVIDNQMPYTPGPGSVKVVDNQTPYTPGPGSVKVADANPPHTAGPGSAKVADNPDKVGAVTAGHSNSPQLPHDERKPLNPNDYRITTAPKTPGL